MDVIFTSIKHNLMCSIKLVCFGAIMFAFTLIIISTFQNKSSFSRKTANIYITDKQHAKLLDECIFSPPNNQVNKNPQIRALPSVCGELP